MESTFELVGVVGFEPTASRFQNEPSTRLTIHSEVGTWRPLSCFISGQTGP